MIKYNKNDKLLKEIVDKLNSSPLLKSCKANRDLYLYGVASNRNTDVVIPAGFPDGNYIQAILNNTGEVKTMRGSLWDLADTYNHKILGLGLNFRKNRKDYVEKVILLHYLALNGLLEIPDKHLNEDLIMGDN